MNPLIHFFLLLSIFCLFQAAPSCSPQSGVLELPAGGKTLYTKYMQGRLSAPKELNDESPIVASIAHFPNGVWVMGGVAKSGKSEFNSIFMWAFRPDGSQYPGYPMDVSDMEDFLMNSMSFELDGCPYELRVVEKTK